MERQLDFESPRFLQDLIGNEERNLAEAEVRLGVELVSRDGWVKIIGEPERVAVAQRLFAELEKLVRGGVAVDGHAFGLVLEQVAGMPERSAGDEAEVASLADELALHKLLTRGGRPGIAPRTKTQLEYVKALRRAEVVFGLGPAGTGKTFLAMAHALDLFLAGEVKRLVLTRPAVEAGEALGFLPGDLNEKILPYLRPLYDAMNDLLGPAEAAKLLEKNVIEVAPLAYMRGRTLKDAAIVLDEAQNTTREQMLMLLTRMGEGSRVIVTGDPSQIDLRPRSKSGLLEARRALVQVKGVEFIEFGQADVVRHPVVRRIVRAYEKFREEEIK